MVDRWAFGPALVLGLAVGSFINLVLDRLSRRESVVYPPSCCSNCRRRLAAWELVPLLSFALLRGRCRTCRTAIGWIHPVVECSVGLAAAAGVVVGGWPVASATLLLLVAGAFVWANHTCGPGKVTRNQRGGLLVEVAVSSTLLVLSVAAMLDPLIAGSGNLHNAGRRLVAEYLAVRQLEEWRSLSFCDLYNGAQPTIPDAPGYQIKQQVDWDGPENRAYISVRVTRAALYLGRTHELTLASWRGRDQECD